MFLQVLFTYTYIYFFASKTISNKKHTQWKKSLKYASVE